jgi:hypothetical protein
MKYNAKKLLYLLILSAVFVSFSVIQAQNTSTPSSMSTSGKGSITLKAHLINEKEEAAQKMVTVSVDVQGVTLQDPMMSSHQMGSGGGDGQGDERKVATPASMQEDQTTGGTKNTNQPTQTSTSGTTEPTQNANTNSTNPTAGTAHLHYQLGTGPDIATATTILTYANLASCKHTIHVKLVDSNHRPLGPADTVSVVIP